MKNMGLNRLVVVAPDAYDSRRAESMAVHAVDVLAAREVYGDLSAAVAGCGFVVGTTQRRRVESRQAETPRELASEIVARCAVNEVALVFGPESHGLTTEELSRCQRFISIPTSEDYGSLNLAQAVLVVAYEVFIASGCVPAAVRRLLAPNERVELMYAKLEEALFEIGFIHPGNATHMMRTVRDILSRAELDDHDVQVLLGMARQMRWAASRVQSA